MAGRWLILADDLTGAADCAIAFGRRGLAAAVTWGEIAGAGARAGDRQHPVISYDAASRGLTAEAAARRHAEILQQLMEPDRLLFKKIDSTLRGQPASETAAALAHLKAQSGSAFGIFAPAFPATNRTTINGRVVVGGRPLEEAEVWKRDHTYDNADIADVLASAGICSEKVLLATIRGGHLKAHLARIASEDSVVAICDAETEHDLHLIAEASLKISPATVFIGSAGLAHALAALDDTSATEKLEIPTSTYGTLIVVGSLAGASRSAARKLVASGTVTHLPVTPEVLLGDKAGQAALAARVTEGLIAGGDVLVEIVMDDNPKMSLGPQLAQNLADALMPVAPSIGAFAATGGETAAALLSRFGVNGIRLADEIEPGVSLGLTLGALSVPIATKAGAFGDENSLIKIRERLHSVRTQGSFT
jgi:uncharacterized protein YgbK (DUF1537 family)